MYTKEQRKQLKNDIKTLVVEQKENRRNRKTVHLIGERTIDANSASGRHGSLRFSLHYHYIAYAIVCGKTPEWIVQHVDKNYPDINTTYLNKLLKKYEEVVCVGAE